MKMNGREREGERELCQDHIISRAEQSRGPSEIGKVGERLEQGSNLGRTISKGW